MAPVSELSVIDILLNRWVILQHFKDLFNLFCKQVLLSLYTKV